MEKPDCIICLHYAESLFAKSLHCLSTKKKAQQNQENPKDKQATIGRPKKQRLPIFATISILS